MKVNWKTSINQSPILFSNRSEWSGFDIRHLRVLPGELDEQADPHRIRNVQDTKAVLQFLGRGK
jgi:hypothetical protein